MIKLLKRNKYGLTALFSLLGVLWLTSPYILAKYIEKTHPYLTIEGAGWDGLTRIRFSKLRINYNGVSGELNGVGLDLAKRRVEAFNGALSVYMVVGGQSPQNGAGKPAKEIPFEMILNGMEISLETNRGTAKLYNTSYIRTKDIDEVYSQTVIANLDGIEATIHGVTFLHKEKILHAESAEATVNLPIALPITVKFGEKLRAEVIDVFIKDKSISAKSISYGPITGTKVSINASKTILAEEIAILHPWLGKTSVVFHEVLAHINSEFVSVSIGPIANGGHPASFNIERNFSQIRGEGTCNEWLLAMPTPLPVALQESLGSYTGKLEFEVTLKPEPKISMIHSCKFTCSSNPIKKLFDPAGFDYNAYHSDGTTFNRHVQFGDKDYALISNIAPALQMAVQSLEDPYFHTHNGIIMAALQNSLLANLKTGKFSRGGSTITMQLAKNIWLSRDKTILRKVNEALLTFALESCLSKEQILEIYLNVVEFGPDLYGIGAASKHYFGKSPYELSSDESFYLAMLLPHPNKAVAPDAGGLLMAQGLQKKLAKAGVLFEAVETEEN